MVASKAVLLCRLPGITSRGCCSPLRHTVSTSFRARIYSRGSLENSSTDGTGCIIFSATAPHKSLFPFSASCKSHELLRNASLIVTARIDGYLVGVSRAVSDFSYCTYLSDPAVDQLYQRRGIGRELLQRTHQAAGLHTSLILLASPHARDYYPHIGLRQHDSCWVVDRVPRANT